MASTNYMNWGGSAPTTGMSTSVYGPSQSFQQPVMKQPQPQIGGNRFTVAQPPQMQPQPLQGMQDLNQLRPNVMSSMNGGMTYPWMQSLQPSQNQINPTPISSVMAPSQNFDLQGLLNRIQYGRMPVQAMGGNGDGQ